MNVPAMMKSVIQFQVDRIRRNLLTFVLIALTAVTVLYVGFRHHAVKQAIAYLLVMWLCSCFVDLYAIKRSARNDFPVRNPKRETLYFLLCTALGLVFFYLRFSGAVGWAHLNPFIKLALIPLVLFVYPVGLAVIMLLLKYKPRDLGLRLQGFIVVIPVIAVSVITNRLVSPQSLTWNMVVAEGGGIAGALFSGFILAGLSEEFFRLIGQTRIGAFLGNKGAGWFITTLIWALMHAPKWYAEGHDVAEALLSSIRIIPIGLMWGYITHRTGSILPAVVVHGTNYWGLQNF
jgi:membrane protease YdiL (CAAX protease family)